VKKEDKKYEKLLNSSPIYIKITLCKAKIYNRQLNHDLALNSINEIKDIVKKKLTNADGVGYLADIYAELGNTYALKKKCVKFEEYYLKAINSRTI
jgi:predicted Zn-dependent protease